MFAFYYCIQDGLSYNAKLPLKKKEELIQKYQLKRVGRIKEYWENNVQIILRNGNFCFNYWTDKTIEYNKKHNLLMNEYEIKPCDQYNFYQVDQEEIYILYEMVINNVIIQVKEYDNFLTITYFCASKIDFFEYLSKDNKVI